MATRATRGALVEWDWDGDFGGGAQRLLPCPRCDLRAAERPRQCPNRSPSERKCVMTTARDIMTPDAECIGANESALLAAHKMADLGVGALPICGTDERLKGVLTDRDIVVKVLAADK